MGYIDSDALKDKFHQICDEFGTETVHIDAIIDTIENMPEADVRENVHGENKNDKYADHDQFICSECGIELADWCRVEEDEETGDCSCSQYVFRFCPNCGADMRGGKSDG